MKKFMILAFVLMTLSACTKKDPNAPANNTLLPDKVAQDLQAVEVATEIETVEGEGDARAALLAAADNGDETTYVNNEFGFEFLKPEGWTQQDGAAGTLVAFLSPEKSDVGFQANINVVVQELTQEMVALSLDEYLDRSMAEIKPYFEALEILEVQDQSFVGKDSKLVTIKVATQGQKLQLRQRIWFADKKVFVITYTANEDGFEADLDSFDIVQNTFRFRD